MLCRPIVLLAEDSTIYSNDRSVCIINQNHYGYEDRGDGHAQDVFQVAPFGGVIFQSSHGAITLRTLVMSALSERATMSFFIIAIPLGLWFRLLPGCRTNSSSPSIRSNSNIWPLRKSRSLIRAIDRHPQHRAVLSEAGFRPVHKIISLGLQKSRPSRRIPNMMGVRLR